MSKKIITLILCLFALATASADERSTEVLTRVDTLLKGYGNYEVRFTVSAAGMSDIDGSYTVSGDRYRIAVGDQTHFSDGKARYEVHEDTEEVVVDKADTASRNMFSNPARAFEFAAADFESSWRGQEPLLGRDCDVVTVRPTGTVQQGGGVVITIFVSVATGLPLAVSYDYDGEAVDISIDKITPLKTVDNALFTFDRARYKDYELIDFR